MNSDQAQLLSVKSTKPQYSRTQSLQSSAATNDYFSDYASDASSTKSDDSKASYETPPSRISTPITQHPQIDSEMTLPARPAAARPASLKTRNDGNEKRRQMLSSFDDMSPPTPGVDDTPYIRFAIEQLTRDEDVMGHGRHESLTSNDFPTTRIMPHEGTEYEAPPPPATPPPLSLPQKTESIPSTPQRPISKRPVPEEILLAVTAPEGQRWAELGFVPLPLHFLALGLYIFLCLWMIIGIIFSNVFALRNHGLYDYDGSGTPRYFVFQYLPQLFGIVLIIWLFVIEAAMYRTLPYVCLSNGHLHDSVLQDFRLYTSNFLLPDLSWFENGEPLLGVVFFIFWLTNITVPLLSSLYQTEWIVDDGPARWRWTSVQGVGWTLFVLYLLLVVAVAYCIYRFQRSKSALMWDPNSLADLVVLFQRSNLCHDFERLEVSQNLQSEIPSKSLRLGYWTTNLRPEIFHSIGEEKAIFKRLSIDTYPPLKEKFNDSQDSSFDMERHRYSYASSFTRNIHSPFVRYRWIPWFLRDSTVLAWIITAILLAIAFLVVSYVNKAVQRGFLPLLGSKTGAGGFSSSNFLYSFLPSLLGMILFLAWQPIDTFFRAVQPFANLSTPIGATAERTLLLSYTSCFPGEVTLLAFLNRDFKVAYISFISLLSLTLPVLAGGVFTAQLFLHENEVRMAASMPGYNALAVFVTIYAFSYLAIWPTRKRYLPHSIDTIADQMSFLYASPLLGEGALRNVKTKADLVARLLGVPAGLTGDGREKRPRARFAFGIYMGKDGKEHLGIDRLQRPGSGEMLVTTGMTR